MFNFGVLVACLSIPTPVVAVMLGWPAWTWFAVPTMLLLAGLAVMAVADD